METNDAVNKSLEIILNDLLELKNHIEQKAPEKIVYLSCPRQWKSTDCNTKMKKLKVKHLSNVNILESCLESKGYI